MLEGRPRNVLSSDPTAYFSTNDCEQLAPWMEVHMPPNVTLLSLSHYSFLHGHHRTSYYRCGVHSLGPSAWGCFLPPLSSLPPSGSALTWMQAQLLLFLHRRLLRCCIKFGSLCQVHLLACSMTGWSLCHTCPRASGAPSTCCCVVLQDALLEDAGRPRLLHAA